jgi:hypothetical protein
MHTFFSWPKQVKVDVQMHVQTLMHMFLLAFLSKTSIHSYQVCIFMKVKVMAIFWKWVDASYGGSFFATLWTFYRMYSIQMPQTHYKIINLTKIFMD